MTPKQKLEEIKERYKYKEIVNLHRTMKFPTLVGLEKDIPWLISELEKAWVMIEGYENTLKIFEKKLWDRVKGESK